MLFDDINSQLNCFNLFRMHHDIPEVEMLRICFIFIVDIVVGVVISFRLILDKLCWDIINNMQVTC